MIMGHSVENRSMREERQGTEEENNNVKNRKEYKYSDILSDISSMK